MRNELLAECLDAHSLTDALHSEFYAGLLTPCRLRDFDRAFRGSRTRMSPAADSQAGLHRWTAANDGGRLMCGASPKPKSALTLEKPSSSSVTSTSGS
jgi:hypothetical protein